MKNSIEATTGGFITSLLVILSVLIINTQTLNAQWIQQFAPESGGIILSIDFLNLQKGITGGWNWENYDGNISGQSFYTLDGGAHWKLSVIPDSVRAITNVKFVSDKTAYAVGAYNLDNSSYRNSPDRNMFLKSDRIQSSKGLAENPNYSALLLKSTDGGASWFTFGKVPDNYNYLYQLEFVNHQDLLMIGTEQSNVNYRGKLGASSDGGNTWRDINLPLNDGDLNCLQYNNGKIFAAGYEKTSISRNSGVILRSDDNGNTWTKKVYDSENGFNDIKFTDNMNGYACGYTFINSDNTESRIYKTTDGGDSWELINIDLQSVAVSKIGIFKNTGIVTIIGSKYIEDPNAPEWKCVVLSSTDYGQNWSTQTSDINPNAMLREINFVDPNNSYMVGATPGGSHQPWNTQIYYTSNGGQSNNQTTMTLSPDDYRLFQNYPNPFNPVTQISFMNVKEEFISLKIYNSTGKEVKSLLEGRQLAGMHTVSFDAGSIPSGIYFYTLSGSSFSQTRKMTLIK